LYRTKSSLLVLLVGISKSLHRLYVNTRRNVVVCTMRGREAKTKQLSRALVEVKKTAVLSL